MADFARAPHWVDPVMRVGFSGRALVYVVVGVLALLAAIYGGQAEGTKGALSTLQGSIWGLITLALIALGMFAYMIWRVICGFMDLDAKGSKAKGIVARIGQVVTGLIHLSLGLYVFGLVFGGGSSSGGGGSGGGGKKQEWTAWLMEQPYGRWLVAIVGLIVIGAGLYYIHKGWKEKYKREIRQSETTEKLNPVLKAGMMANGVVIAIIGGFFVWSAWTFDPSKAGGIGQAFEVIRASPFGQILLGLIALGLIAFGVFCAVCAIYRIVPRRATADTPVLAGDTIGALRLGAAKTKGKAKAAVS